MKLPPGHERDFVCKFCGKNYCAICNYLNNHINGACLDCGETKNKLERSFRPKNNVLFKKLANRKEQGLTKFTLSEQYKIFESNILKTTPKHILRFYDDTLFKAEIEKLNSLFGERPFIRPTPRPIRLKSVSIV